MDANSKHANWLLLMLLITLLLSSLVLGWLLTRSSLFASPQLLSATQVNESIQTTQALQTSNKVLVASSPQLAQSHTPKQAISTLSATSGKQASNTGVNETNKPTFSLSLLDSQQNLAQAALTPDAVLPLASLIAYSPTPNLPKTTAPAALSTQGLTDALAVDKLSNTPTKTGWLYAGQFQNGQWTLVGLDIKPSLLPEAHTRYKLIWGAKLRSAPPSQRFTNAGNANLADSIGYLAEGTTIQVLTVKPSGKNGHIWLEISY